MASERYVLRKARNSKKYYVVSTLSKRKHSKKPLSKTMARRQQRALYAAKRRSLRGGHYGMGMGPGCCRCGLRGGGCGCGGLSPNGGLDSSKFLKSAALGSVVGAVSRNAGLGVGTGLLAYNF